MKGMDRQTGKWIDDRAHTRQSIEMILTTRLSSRVMRPTFPGVLSELQDRPVNDSTLLSFFAAIAKAIADWEPRYRLDRVSLVGVEDGRATFRLDGTYVPDGKPLTLERLSIT